MTKTSCCSVTKKTNLKRLPVLVPCIAESICSWASPKACAIMRCRKRWRLEAQGSANHPFCRPVVVRLGFPVPLLLRVIYYKKVLTGLLTFLLSPCPSSQSPHLTIFLKHTTHWFSPLKILKDFPFLATYIPKFLYGTQSLSWFRT